MAVRKSRRAYHSEVTREPFELDLDTAPEGHPGFVTFLDPNRLGTESAFELARSGDPEVQVQLLLSDVDFAAFWAEWRHTPVEETNALLADVFDHYGMSLGKRRR